MKTALIISGGEFSKICTNISYDFVIACDKGYEFAKKMNITPDLILGDFDSYEGDITKDNPGINILTYPIIKDDTDTMLAIKYALNNGYKHIILSCALGNRFDHTISNIESLHYIASHNGVGEIISENEYLRTFSAFEKEIVLNKRLGYSLSLFSLSDKSEGISIKGAKYNAENISLTNNFPLGHGNSFINDSVTINLNKGILLIVESKI